MEIIKEINILREKIKVRKSEGRVIGFVPTMGFLHKGHLSLVEESKKYSDFQIMSIFVNRIQFNDTSDFESYPSDLQKDFKLAEDAGVDIIFLPDDAEMYRNNLTSVDVEILTENLCGAHRPGHFKGVFTVVSKLFNIVQPDIAVFGQKDIQQAISIQKMVNDLNFPLRIVLAPIVREKDGLALSSRNKHLTSEQRENALCLSRSLEKAKQVIEAGETSVRNIISEMESVIRQGNPDSIDYISVVSYEDLGLINEIDVKSVIAAAVFFGSTRLIDNIIIEAGNGK